MMNNAEKPQLTIPRVSGSIHVTNGRADMYRQFHSTSKWFDECDMKFRLMIPINKNK